MLTDDELEQIFDQEGPLGGQPVFDTAWRVAAVLAPAELDERAHYALIYDLRFKFPHHEPVLRDYRRWVTDPNLSGRQRCDRTAKEWLPKLAKLDPLDRALAAKQLAELVNSPKLKARVAEVIAAITAP